jgi:hypothetical protein
MNRDEMLKHLGVTAPELADFLRKFSAFLSTLDKAEQAMMHRALPTLHQIHKAFGPDVSADELLHLFGGDSEHPPVFMAPPLEQHRS